MSIAARLAQIHMELPDRVTLVAVSKTKPESDILEAYAAGQRIFGENKIQEMVGKQQRLPKDIQWHMIGHVQRNKVKYMVPFVSLVHGVDQIKLLEEINKQARKVQRKIPVLLQVHIARETTKFGFDAEEIRDMLKTDLLPRLGNITVKGLMGMASFTSKEAVVRREFRALKELYDETAQVLPNISILSMGMSGDYQIAVEEGSTMVRLGSSIFGVRD